MAYFPMCISLENSYIILVGEGTSALEKLQVLLPFGSTIHLFTENGFTEKMWDNHPQLKRFRRTLTVNDLETSPHPAFVVVADTDFSEKERISTLCRTRNIPINVVDVPALCSFYFPSIIQKGDLIVSVSTGGKSPGAAAYLRRTIEPEIPDRADDILEWLSEIRTSCNPYLSSDNRRAFLKQVVSEAFQKNKPLTTNEVQTILDSFL